MNEADQANATATALPELTQAVLDDATLDQLFVDLASLTQVLEVSAKYAERGYVAPEASRLTLADARVLLARRAVRGVQIRYRYDGTEWWDTLMLTPAGVRIVRIAAPSVAC